LLNNKSPHPTQTVQSKPEENMKKLLSSVNCACRPAIGRPESFYVEMSEQLISRIQSLAMTAGELNAVSIDVFTQEGEFSDIEVKYGQLSDGYTNLDEVVEMTKAEYCEVENQLVRVAKNTFQFVAIPKHCDEDMTIKTHAIPITELNNNELYVELD
jgi:hypothetical protein